MKPEIKNLKQYEEALLKLQELFNTIPDTPEGEQLDKLAKDIEDFEDKEFPMED